MRSFKTFGLAILGLALGSMACKTYDTSLGYVTYNQPIQFGSVPEVLEVDTLGIVEGFVEYEFEEDTYSANHHTTISISGGEYADDNLDSTIYRALDVHPANFIANAEVEVGVEYGIKPAAFIFGTLASMITGGEMSVGSYTKKSFMYYGVVFKPKVVEK
jgi:hypothetical protein